MNRKFALTLSLLVMLCVGLAGQALVQGRTVGVSVNDNFLYHVRGYYSSVNGMGVVPSDVLSWNKTISYEVIVSGISGMNVTTEDKISFTNGTITPAVISQNVESGARYFMTAIISEDIICANLSVGDPMYPTASNDPRKVNSTIKIDYGAITRDTNTVSFTYPVLNDYNRQIGEVNRIDYFDKATGVLTGRYESTLTATENVTIVVSLRETSLWAITDAPQIVPTGQSTSPASDMIQLFGYNVSLPILIGAIAVVLVVFVVIVPGVVLKSRRNRRRHRR
jgi:hypothetical protein